MAKGEVDSIRSGPVVSIIVATFNAASTIGTALRSLLAQTYKNIQIIVVDDCSTDQGETISAVEKYIDDSGTIDLIRLNTNGGAYVARNSGLDIAEGKYVTLHDADDWSHPQKIERQVAYMEANPDCMACTSEQARTTNELDFAKVRSHLITYNTSSLMFRRTPVAKQLGYWDTVRLGADSEFIGRIQKVFGERSFRKLRTGPLSFQRISDSSVTTSNTTGLSGVYYGVRREYHDAQKFHISKAPSLRYENWTEGAFLAPRMMRSKRGNRDQEPGHYPLVIFGDFREPSGSIRNFLDELPVLIDKYGRIGLVEAQIYDAPLPSAMGICPEVRSRLVDGVVEVVVYGETVTCDVTLRLQEDAGVGQKFLPDVRVKY
ncbi:glycosyltransferase family 2 protein [Histidinibacterium aquaticum]|uniref:Glycosyltransferase family 2 protein n=2 Tax=Histidinibacterium aquaticum TaxID=2613962 RepID=A0A5J5GB49_9RHOB|nr:glycosyltransferase family 2 protein [Histidinibacterium aquaticum]